MSQARQNNQQPQRPQQQGHIQQRHSLLYMIIFDHRYTIGFLIVVAILYPLIWIGVNPQGFMAWWNNVMTMITAIIITIVVIAFMLLWIRSIFTKKHK